MSRYIYVNGQYLPYTSATVHVEDRGFQFADAVYEVMEVYNGQPMDQEGHFSRLRRSLSELKISAPLSLNALSIVVNECIRKNRVSNGLVYIQISRGHARRDFVFPAPAVHPTVVCYARSVSRSLGNSIAEEGISVVTMPDIRWKRPDIKSTSLLPNVLARQAAKEENAKEAWLLDKDQFVTEGAASNAWIISSDGELITRPVDGRILRGVTRGVVMTMAQDRGHNIIERPFSLDEALKAKEAFITAATAIIMPVVRINSHTIGNGTPGEFALELRKHFHNRP